MLKMLKRKKWIWYYTSAWTLRLVLHGCWRCEGPLLHFITLHQRLHSHRGPPRFGASSRTCACLMQRKGHDLCLHTRDKTRGPEGAWKKSYLMWLLLIAGMNIGTKYFLFLFLNLVLHIFSSSLVKHWETFSYSDSIKVELVDLIPALLFFSMVFFDLCASHHFEEDLYRQILS